SRGGRRCPLLRRLVQRGGCGFPEARVGGEGLRPPQPEGQTGAPEAPRPAEGRPVRRTARTPAELLRGRGPPTVRPPAARRPLLRGVRVGGGRQTAGRAARRGPERVAARELAVRPQPNGGRAVLRIRPWVRVEGDRSGVLPAAGSRRAGGAPA